MDLVIAMYLNWHPDSFDTLRQGDSFVPPYDWLSRPAFAPLPGLAGGRVLVLL
jgi:hypothetical protein